MLEFLSQNWGTILTALVLAVIVVLIIVNMRKNKKAGKNSCGCGCENCPSAGMCRKK